MKTYHYRLAGISAMVMIAAAFGAAGLKAQDVQKEGFVDPKALVDENAMTDVKDKSWVNPGIMVEESVLPEESVRKTPQKLTAEDLKIKAAKESWVDPGLMAGSAATNAHDGAGASGGIVTYTVAVPGDRIEYPIVIGTYGAFFSWSNTKNTGSLTNTYTGRPTNDVFYVLTLNCAMEVEITTCGSDLADTYVTLLNSSGGYMETFDDVQTAGTCSSIRHEYVKRNLSAGTYYLVCEGWSQNGSITTRVAGRPGNTITTAINAGTYGAFFTWSDIQNTGNFTNAYTGRSTNDVFYRFTLNCPMEVEIKTCGSALADTYITLLNGSGGYLEPFDDVQTAGTCSSRFHENARKTLSAGTYYLVCEGWSQNGSITTQLTGRPGNSMATAINAGTYGAFFTWSDLQNTGNFTNTYTGRSTSDVFYRFTLTKKMKVTITHCGSFTDTWMHLLDASGNPMTDNYYYFSYTGICSASIQRELEAGTYYVVSEGYHQNGAIQTNITGLIYGENMPNTITAGSFGKSFQYSDTQNTESRPNFYHGRTANDVFYRFTLTQKMLVTMTHCGSSLDTYMHLLDASGNLITSNDNWSGEGACGSTLHSFIQRELAAGTYYVVSEGYRQNGNIQTNISGVIPGDSRTYPIVAGAPHVSAFTGSFQYSDIKNTTAFTNTDPVRSTNDVFYRFTLSKKMMVTMTHCGSTLDNTYMQLMDASGRVIAGNDDWSGISACASAYHSVIRRELAAGTYYVISEGNRQNGSIQTGISGYVDEYGYTEPPPVSVSTDPEAVGGAGSRFDVSPAGAAVCTIPIEVPPGVGGMQPSIALVYNSQGGNGVAGWGCSLAGISVITRAPKDIYHDGAAKGLTHNLADAFVLDGQRLIYDKGCGVSEGGIGAVYHPENDPLTKVTIQGGYSTTYIGDLILDMDDNRWFQVEREGVTRYYGRTDNASTINSRQEYTKELLSLINSHHRVNAWYLGYVKDVHGNYMVYSYDDQGDARARYPSGITWGKNTGASSTLQNSVSFEYSATSRQDPITYMMNGVDVKLRRLLSGITCKTGNSVYRTYTLGYNTTGDGSGMKHSRLTTVTVRNGAGEALKPVTLEWSFLPATTFTDYTLPTFPASSSTGDKHYFGADLNGDGISDLVEIDVNKYVTQSAATVYRSEYSGGQVSFLPSPDEILLPQEFKATSGNAWQSTSGNMIIGNEGAQYVFKPSWEAIGPDKFFYFTLFSHFGLSTALSGEQARALKKNSEEPPYVTGDVNNDGNDDFIYLAKEKTGGRYCGEIGRLKSFSATGKKFTWLDVSVSLPDKPEKLFLSDFDGDGMNDLLIFHSSGYAILWNTGNPDRPFMESSLPFFGDRRTSGTSMTNVWMIRQGDFNGDGLPDFLMNATGDKKWYFAVNKGDGAFTRYSACTLEVYDQDFTGHDDERFSCHVFDFDHDGKSDVVITKAMYNKEDPLIGKTWGSFRKVYTYWMRSTGDGLKQVSALTSNPEHDSESRFIVCGDFNGDGQPEMVNYGYDLYGSSSTSRMWRVYRHPDLTAASGRVTGIRDMAGATGITYGFMTDPSLYTKGSGGIGNSLPVADVVPPLSAVRKVTVPGGSAGDMTVNYTYGGMKVHTEGLGFIGMQRVTAKNTTTGVETATETGPWDAVPALIAPGTLYTKTSVVEDGVKKTATVETKTTYQVEATGSHYSFLKWRKETDMDGNTVSSFYNYGFEYNDASRTRYYYPVSDSTVYGAGMYRIVRYGNYTSTQSGYRPRLETVEQKHSDDAPFVQKTQLEYNTKGLPYKKIEKYGLPESLTTEYGYDAFGNCTSSKVSGEGLATMTHYNEYDATKRFIVKTYTSPASTTATFTYDTWGNVLTETDATNSSALLTTTHTYNNWGQRTSSVSPEGLKTTFLRGWNSDHAVKSYFILTRGHGRPWMKTWYDRLGRETGVETIGPKSMSISKTYTYNHRGQLTRASNKQGDLYIGESFSYDDRGRPESQYVSGGQSATTTFSRQTASHTYGNRSQETTDGGGRLYSKTFDAWGNIKSSTDPAGSVSYLYHSSGQPKTVTAAGATFTMTYDAAGNQATLTDPNAGTTSWTYDAAGRVKTQTDGRGKTLYNFYDGLNRLSRSAAGLVLTEYTYDASHRLTRMKTDNDYIAWTYDPYGRMLTEKRNVDGAGMLEFSYAYGSNGQLETTTTPEGLQVNNEYDPYGNLVQVSAGTWPTWTLMSASGSSTSSLLNGFMVASTTLNYRGTLSNLKTVSAPDIIPGATTLRNMDFVFDDATGNLTSRTGMLPQKETFYYDNLDRLTAVKHGSPETPAMSVGYSNKGNISSKTGIGTYRYNASKVHALEEVDNTDGLVPEGDQAITYNAFNKVSQITETAGDETRQLDITYGPDGQRWKTELRKNGNVVKTVIFAGDYERVIKNDTTTHLYYMEGGGIHVKQVKGSTTLLREGRYYVHPDHLGSLTLITDATGGTVQKCSFDAWGKRTFITKTPSLVFDRGFTGHEHLDEFGLINMNGRMYDPVVGRFLSPDPFVQAPEFSQSYNRYSYALNNPLRYTDPTGEFFFAAVGIGILLNAACWGAAISAVTYTASVGFSDGGFNNWNWGQFGKSVGIGAISGFVSAGIGQMFGPVGSMGFGGEIARASTHGFAQGMISQFTGGDFMQGFAAGGLGSLAGSAFMMYGGNFGRSIAGNYAFSGLSGGIGAELSGGNFWEGAATGLIVAGMNHLQQGLAMPKRLEEKMDEAWAQERARQARADAPRNPYDVEAKTQYIPGVDFEIGRPYGNFEGRDYVYETTIDGVKVRANVNYSTSTEDKTVRLLKYDSKITPDRTGGYYRKGGYVVEFKPMTGWNISTMTFQSVNHYQLYLRSRLY
ncbi:MAG: FG-GAP-like repeat-containing protein [Bacteroidales bacterium]|jgi:RHS repeat-associated protein|nr:FG-GAP-like repeat-containing protein [Bacteroidales bacterium]